MSSQNVTTVPSATTNAPIPVATNAFLVVVPKSFAAIPDFFAARAT